LDAFARTMAVNRFVECAALVNLVAVSAEHQIALLQASLFAWAARHNRCNYHMLSQSLGEHAQPKPRGNARTVSVANQLVAARQETFTGNSQDRPHQVGETEVGEPQDLPL
jgi:hypothetical protein